MSVPSPEPPNDSYPKAYVTSSVSSPLPLCKLSSFTHVYSFNIGMPTDVTDHILKVIARSPSVK